MNNAYGFIRHTWYPDVDVESYCPPLIFRQSLLWLHSEGFSKDKNCFFSVEYLSDNIVKGSDKKLKLEVGLDIRTNPMCAQSL